MGNLINTLLILGTIGAVAEGMFRGGVRRFGSVVALIFSVIMAPVAMLPMKTYIAQNSKLYAVVNEKYAELNSYSLFHFNFANALLCTIAFWVIYIILLIIVKILFSSGKIFTGLIVGGVIDRVLGAIGGAVGFILHIMLILAAVSVLSFLPVINFIFQELNEVPSLNWMISHNLVLIVFQAIFG